MSVIGKMNLRGEKTFETGQAVTLGVVCENAFMSHYNPQNENVVFTRYSPSGEAELHFDVPQEWPTKTMSYAEAATGTVKEYEVPGECYLIYLRQAERPDVSRAKFFSPLRCNSRTDFGSDLRTFEFVGPYLGRDARLDPKQPRRISIKLGIDNPCASSQFEPGTDGWWVVAYSAAEMSMDEALSLVHSLA
jgi:hypothetical protein